MLGLFEDVRYGLRALAKNRGLTAVAVLSLGLGIGANTTIFSLVHAILLRPLPVREPARLAEVYTVDPRIPGDWGCSFPNFRDYRDRNSVFSSMFVYTAVRLNLTGGAEPRPVTGQLTSANYFSTLGVNPVRGRGFLSDEDTGEGAHPVAVISYRFWQQEFAGDPSVTSRTLSLNGRGYSIIGVAPKGFEGLDTLTATDIWVPMAMYPQLRPSSDLATHVALYRAFPSIGGVVHTHSRHATAWAQAGREIPCFGTTHADYFHGPVPLTAPLTPEEIHLDYEVNTGVAIVRRIEGLDPLGCPGVLVHGHGPFTWGKNVMDAAHMAVIVEELAAMAWMTVTINPEARPISQAQRDKHHFRKHGPKAYYGQK